MCLSNKPLRHYFAHAERQEETKTMPLSKAKPRRAMHTREVICRGYLRDDGLWDIEGSITDVKAYSVPDSQTVAGEPVHHMLMRLTIDNDFVVHDVEVSTEAGPH